LRSDDQSQETCPDDVAAFERPRKGVQAAGNFSFPEKVPSPACHFRVAEEVAGFCIFNLKVFREKDFLCATFAPSASLR